MRVQHLKESQGHPGEKQFFIGDVTVVPVVDSADGVDIILVRFAPGARTYLHTHQVPQILHCNDGRGILATKGERNLVEPGDVVVVEAGEEHWHGATADSHFVHLSVRPPGETMWTKVDPLG